MRARLGDEQGLSLIELLIVMFLFGIVGSTLSAAFLAVDRASVTTRQQNTDLADASLGVDAATRQLRGAAYLAENPGPLLLAAQPNQVQFYAAAGTLHPTYPALVNLVVQGAGPAGMNLVQQTTVPTGPPSPTWTFNGTTTQRILARELTSNQVFTFYGEDYDPYATPPNTAALNPATLNRADVNTVVVALTSRELDAFGIPTSAVRTRVYLENYITGVSP